MPTWQRLPDCRTFAAQITKAVQCLEPRRARTPYARRSSYARAQAMLACSSKRALILSTFSATHLLRLRRRRSALGRSASRRRCGSVCLIASTPVGRGLFDELAARWWRTSHTDGEPARRLRAAREDAFGCFPLGEGGPGSRDEWDPLSVGLSTAQIRHNDDRSGSSGHLMTSPGCTYRVAAGQLQHAPVMSFRSRVAPVNRNRRRPPLERLQVLVAILQPR